MYVFETFLAGIHRNALERILERVRNVNGTRSERKWDAFGTQMERVRNTNGARSEHKWSAFGTQMERVRNTNGTRSEHKWSAFGTQMERERSVRLFLSSIVSCKFSFFISI